MKLGEALDDRHRTALSACGIGVTLDRQVPLVHCSLVIIDLWRTARGRRRGALGRAHRNLSYYALGYVSTFCKDTDARG